MPEFHLNYRMILSQSSMEGLVFLDKQLAGEI